MPTAALVFSPAQPASLRELARALAFELERQGVPCRFPDEAVRDPRHDHVNVLLDPVGYFDAHEPGEFADRATLARTAFIYEQGQLPARGSDGWSLARQAGAVFTLDVRSAGRLQRSGTHARVLRLGYSESLDRYREDAARPIDVALLAPRTTRNARCASEVRHALSAFSVEAHDPSRAGGPELPSILGRSKLMLNLHGDEGTELRWQDALEAIHAGAVVVTEHSSMIAPLKVGEHLLVASAQSLPYVAESLLRDPGRLAQIQRAAYERIRSWMPFALAASILRAALVEIVSSPMPIIRSDA